MKTISLYVLTMIILVFSNWSVFAEEPLLPGAKDLANRMIKSVDIVKLILYKILTEDHLIIYKEKGIDYCKDLAAASVNEIYDNHNHKTLMFLNSNREDVVNGIIDLGKKHPDLKRPITDSIRVFVQANWMLTGDSKYYELKVFENAMARGIFIEGGEHPKPDAFLKMVDDLAKKYNIYK